MENESIIKVMHGAEMDTKWLQRDFNIHILNLFDTHRASRVLGFPKLSMRICSITTAIKQQIRHSNLQTGGKGL
uniref:3'-5' exonuclease domain-containing protein n=1 Tax=Nymphaea colorata TaxID=210225 RepID=A0A5K1HAX8_9MAGN|nr:unnamed protein product [Nymphaea colorata]